MTQHKGTGWQAMQSRLDAVLVEQRAAAAAREQAAVAQVAAYARRVAAARRIQRAWRSWRCSDAYAARVRAAIRLQGSVRAWRLRRGGRFDAMRLAARAKVRSLLVIFLLH